MDNTSFNVLKAILNQIIESYPHRIINKESHIKVIGFPSDAMSIEIGCWTCGVHYWDAYYYLFESVKKSFDEHGIQLAKEDAMEND